MAMGTPNTCNYKQTMAHQEKQMHCPVKLIMTCIKCNNYLTVSPIFITPNGYICGCCKTDNKSIKIRATAYENLAKLLLFPCANQKFGCDKFTQFNNVTHDSVCNFNRFKCPTLTKCNEILRLNDIVHHYNHKHKNMIVYHYFQISQRSDIETCKLLMHNEKAFLLELRTIETGKCSISLCYVDDQTSYNKYRVEVTSEIFGDDLCFLGEQRILQYNPKCFPSEHNTTIVDFNTLKEIMIGRNFNFEIHLIEEQPKTTTYPIDNVSDNKRQTETVRQTTKPIEDGFIEELECFVCKEYMTPPIFVCKTGHSLCNGCKKRIKQCPLCAANYEGTRNLVLEKLTEYEYPCRNNVHGCQFIDKLINLQKHEKNCMQIMCPLYNLGNCKHKGSIHTIYQHLQQAHPQQLYNLNQPITYNMNGMSVSNLHFVQYDGKVFEITINYKWKPNVLWRVRQIDATIDNNRKYKFIIDFIDQTNQERILTIGDLCESSEQYSNNSINLPDHLLKPFIDDNRLLYFKLDLRRL